MPDLQPSSQNDFMVERIKVKPVNRKKLLRRTLLTVGLAVLFGLVACFTFLILEPVISNWLYPPEQQGTQMVVFPEDQDEMSPEEMLAENLPVESPSPEPQGGPEEGQNLEGESQEPTLREQVTEILADIPLELRHYKELFSALSAYVNELNHSMVTVTAVTSNIDWLNDVRESRNQCPGLIFSENGMDLLILTKYSAVMSAERLLLTFWEGSQVEARLKQYNGEMDLAVLTVSLEELPQGLRWENGALPMAKFGTSNLRNLAGTPVVALGSPMGTSNSMGMGMITSGGTVLSMTDRNYRLIQTDISGSQNAGGVLFDLQGQVLGIITDNKVGSDMKNMITAYGVSELQKVVEKMANGIPLAYMGIRGVDVPREANQELGVPYGAYVQELEMDSPAMQAGILPGDVITKMDDRVVGNFSSYSTALMQMEPGQTVHVVVMRQAQEGYKEMSFNIELSEVE